MYILMSTFKVIFDEVASDGLDSMVTKLSYTYEELYLRGKLQLFLIMRIAIMRNFEIILIKQIAPHL